MPDPLAAESEAELERHAALLDEAERALERLREGAHGRCESCGGEIAAELQAADPLRRRCGACTGEPPPAVAGGGRPGD